jgi:hypothetical protein
VDDVQQHGAEQLVCLLSQRLELVNDELSLTLKPSEDNIVDGEVLPAVAKLGQIQLTH